MTSGEKRLSERLEQKLEEDYLLWYDVPVGPRQRHPDFIVFHPRRGLLVLEVKDWKPDTIRQADNTQFSLATDRGLVTEHSPLLQARAYALEIKTALEHDPALRHPHGHHYAGKLIMPVGFGVVLANISRKQFEAGELDKVLPAHLVLCQDEMFESVDAEAFQQRLWAMFTQTFAVAITLPQIDRVRWHLFPEIRVEAGEGQFGLFPANGGPRSLEIPELIKVMDAQQEQLARSLGDEHRIIHGVAGSGKTMILGFRAMQLARAFSRPILILCYNKTLAARLEQLMGERGLSDKVQVYNFHKWCRSMLTAYHVPLPAGSGSTFTNALPPAVIAGVDRGQIPRFQYGAVLIDEGHDFEPDWYKLIVQMIDPATNSLLVLYDDAQNIYGQANRKKLSWKSLGVQAQGRTTILKLNYRNTLEILAVARGFANELLDARSDDDDDSVPLVSPESAGRRGPLPELIRVERTDDQLPALIQRLRDEQAGGRRLSDMAVIFRNSWEGEKLHEALKRADIPSRLAEGNGKSSLFVVDDTVKLVTMHSSKGLEFPLVIIPGLGSLPKQGKNEADEARLLYVAMTRATERLVLIHHEDSVFSQRIRNAINDVQGQLAALA